MRWKYYLRFGQCSFLGGDGRMYTVNYIADEKGFRAQGAHLPWSLPVDINQVLQSEVLLLDVQDDQVNPQLVDGIVTLPKDPVVIVESQPEIIKGEIAIKPADIELIKDKDEVLKGQDIGAIKKKNPTQQVFSKDRATEKLTIHVPLFTKVYSLSKSPKSVSKSIGKGSQPSRIIRYKLAFQPAFGGNVLTPLSDWTSGGIVKGHLRVSIEIVF